MRVDVTSIAAYKRLAAAVITSGFQAYHRAVNRKWKHGEKKNAHTVLPFLRSESVFHKLLDIEPHLIERSIRGIDDGSINPQSQTSITQERKHKELRDQGLKRGGGRAFILSEDQKKAVYELVMSHKKTRRQMAQELGCAQAIITRAIQQLSGDTYIDGRTERFTKPT